MDDESIYSQLTTKTLSTVSATDINTQTAPIHLEKENEDILHSTVLVNKATFRGDGGPIPGTARCYEVESDTGGKFPFFTPAAGECWLFIGASTGTLNGTGVLKLQDQVAPNVEVEVGQESTGGVNFTPVQEPLYIDENVNLIVNFTSVTGDCYVQAAFIRVR